MGRAIARRTTLAVLASAGVTTMLARNGFARSSPQACEEIRQAMTAGMTLEQIERQFGADEAQVLKCAQPKGRKGKAKRQKTPHSKSAGGESAASGGVRAKTAANPATSSGSGHGAARH